MLVEPVGTVVNAFPEVRNVLLLNVILVIVTPATVFWNTVHEAMFVPGATLYTEHLIAPYTSAVDPTPGNHTRCVG